MSYEAATEEFLDQQPINSTYDADRFDHISIDLAAKYPDLYVLKQWNILAGHGVSPGDPEWSAWIQHRHSFKGLLTRHMRRLEPPERRCEIWVDKPRDLYVNRPIISSIGHANEQLRTKVGKLLRSHIDKQNARLAAALELGLLSDRDRDRLERMCQTAEDYAQEVDDTFKRGTQKLNRDRTYFQQAIRDEPDPAKKRELRKLLKFWAA